jgi:hypothetical protein
MATLTDVYRRQTLVLRAETLRDLHRLWPALDGRQLDRTFPAWLTAVSAVIARDRLTVAGLASAYLRAFRLTSDVPGLPTIVLADPAPREQVETAMRVTTLVAAKRATAAGLGVREAMAQAFVQSSGAATRLVLDAGRETVMASVAADPQAAGWQRVTSGSGCAFCQMLAGRGEVFSESSADFASHDHCRCSAAPVWGGEGRVVKDYVPSTRNISDVDRARVRKYLRQHPNA